jgi:hypothetical protein
MRKDIEGANEWTSADTSRSADLDRIMFPLPMEGLRADNRDAFVDGCAGNLICSGRASPAARSQLAKSLALFGRQLGEIQRVVVTNTHLALSNSATG